MNQETENLIGKKRDMAIAEINRMLKKHEERLDDHEKRIKALEFQKSK